MGEYVEGFYIEKGMNKENSILYRTEDGRWNYILRNEPKKPSGNVKIVSYIFLGVRNDSNALRYNVKKVDKPYWVPENYKDELAEISVSGGSKNGSPVKTSRTYKGKDGVTRVLYKRGVDFYVKKRSEKTGKFGYRKVNVLCFC